MKYLQFPFILLLILCTIGCTRDDFDEGEIEYDPIPEPEIILETPENVSFGVSYKIGDQEFANIHQDGYGSFEPTLGLAQPYFVEVVVPVTNNSGTNPFLLGWFHPEIAPGVSPGEIGVLAFKDADGNFDYVSSDLINNTSFELELKEVGPIGTFMKGNFRGTGIQRSTGREVPFSGSFSVPRVGSISQPQEGCLKNVEINPEEYNNTNEDYLTIENAIIIEDCLFIITESTESCHPGNIILFDVGSIAFSNPPKRFIRIVDKTENPCAENTISGFAYDIKSLRVDGSNEVEFELNGWDEPLIYKY